MNPRPYIAEAVGTFVLVFAGTAAIVADAQTGRVTHVGVALTFGLVVMTMIYAVGETSGAHLNPAVTLAFAAARRFPAARVAGYVAAQLAGAFGASLLVRALFPTAATLGQTLPAGGPWQAFSLELVLTAILVFVILRVSTGSREVGTMAGIAVGGVIGLEALFAGPISGASMNPARSLAPAVVAGDPRHLWVYLAAPAAGALLGVALWRALRGDGLGPVPPAA